MGNFRTLSKSFSLRNLKSTKWDRLNLSNISAPFSYFQLRSVSNEVTKKSLLLLIKILIGFNWKLCFSNGEIDASEKMVQRIILVWNFLLLQSSFQLNIKMSSVALTRRTVRSIEMHFVMSCEDERQYYRVTQKRTECNKVVRREKL